MFDADNKQHAQWLSPSYLQKALQSYLQDNSIRIQNLSVMPATERSGENYGSVLKRIAIAFRAEKDMTPHEMSFILKCSFESDPFTTKALEAYGVYNTEMTMYDQILPQLAKILAEVGESEKLFAETLLIDYTNSALIFEDLTRKNYVVSDRLKGLDELHARMVMKKLAKLHAAAAVLNERLDGGLEKLDRGLFNSHVQGCLGRMCEHFIEVCATFAKTCPELGPYYHQKLIKLKPYVVSYATKAYNSNNSHHFHTLSHGDLWITNIMMLYNKSLGIKHKLKDVLFIDFQFSNWSSAAVDLYYFFHTSLEPHLILNVKVHQKLVQYYHSVLKDMLRRLKYQGHIPILHELCVQLEKGKFLAVATTVANLAVAIADQCDGADFHCLVDDSKRARVFRTNCYKNKRLQEIIKVKLPYYDRCGLLDIQK